jgi:hypothetical protein
MSRSDTRTLINRGRKAGLRTAELYSALAARPPEAGEGGWQQTDGNGFVSGYTQNGRRVYRPLDGTATR